MTDYETVITFLNAKEYARQLKFDIVMGYGNRFFVTRKGKG